MSKLEKYTQLHQIAKKMQQAMQHLPSGFERDFAMSTGGFVLGKIAEEMDLDGAVGPVAFALVIKNPNVGLNTLIRGIKAIEEDGCGMCPACLAKEQEQAPKASKEDELKDFLGKLFGENIQVHVIQVGKGPTKH